MSNPPKCGICGRFIKLSELDRKDVYDHLGLSDTIFYHKSCINPPPMPNPTPELPVWMREKIANDAQRFDGDSAYYIGKRDGYYAGATEYTSLALKLASALEQISNAPLPLNDREFISWVETARELSNKALALFPVDKKKEDAE